MILVFSKTFDTSTNDVMRWLHHLGQRDVVRINSDAPIEPTAFYMEDDRFDIRVGERDIAIEEIDAVWFRKGQFSLAQLYPRVSISGHSTLAAEISGIFTHEQTRMSEYFQYLLRKTTRVLGNPFISVPNKLVTLDLARSVGLHTPKFIVSNIKTKFISALETGEKFITKAIADGIFVRDYKVTGTGYFTYTEKLNRHNVDVLKDKITPSLIQEEIEKKIELRIFYLDGILYSSAIYSQADESTKVDFRKYNFAKPNRIVPFKLPKHIERQIISLFALMDLNTGSMDMILDSAGRYVFLEINPVGQYEWISRACNYGLDKKIAQWLIG